VRVDRVLVVDVDEGVQLKRLMERDGGSMEQAKAILAAQASRATRLQAADDVLPNVGSLSQLQHGVDQLHQRYVDLAGWRNDHTGQLT
jgi:dephospho-CoA kinase